MLNTVYVRTLLDNNCNVQYIICRIRTVPANSMRG